MKWYTRAELEQNSPSRKDGIDATREQQFRKTYCNFIKQLIQELKLPAWVRETATVFTHRFFAERSFLKNDRFLVGATCVFLACKVEESPRALRDVAYVMHKTKNANKPDELEKLRLNSEVVLAPLMEHILQAERAVLFTLCFSLNIEHPYSIMFKALEALGLDFRKDRAHANLLQQIVNMLNDSLVTTLWLQYPPMKLGHAVAFELIRLSNFPLPLPDGKTYCQHFDITQAEIDDILPQIMALYNKPKAKATATPVATGAAGEPAASAPAAKPGPPMPSFRPIILQDDGQVVEGARPGMVKAPEKVDVEDGELPCSKHPVSGSAPHDNGSAPASVATPQLQNGACGGSGRAVGSPRDSDGEDGVGHAPSSADQNNHSEPDVPVAGAQAQALVSRKRTRSPGGLEEGEIGVALPCTKSPCLGHAA